MNFRNLLMWGLIVLLSVGLFNLFQDPPRTRTQKEQIAFSKFLEEVDNGRVVQVEIQGNNIKGVLSDGSKFNTYSPNYPELVGKLSEKNVNIIASPVEDKMPSLNRCTFILVSNAFTNWCMDIFYASNARWKRWSYGFWKIKSKTFNRSSRKSYI